jgi:hypothetical protein
MRRAHAGRRVDFSAGHRPVQNRRGRTRRFATAGIPLSYRTMAQLPSAAPGSVALFLEPTRKLIRLQYRGAVRPEDIEALIPRIDDALAQFGAGFVFVTDFTELEQMDLGCVRPITRLMDRCLAAGIAKAIRVIPDPGKDIGMNLLSLVHYRGKVPTVTCETREEAERELAGSAGR